MADDEAKDTKPTQPKKLNQVIGAIAACMGGFSLGTIIGWSSPGQDIFTGDGIDVDVFPHIVSIMCLGAACVQLYLFLTLDRIGRKWTMIILAVPLIIFWILLGVIKNWIVSLVSRFCLGFCGGGFCVVAPTYIGEYSDKTIRGTLGIMFQLLLVIGILFSYASGLANNRYVLCLPMVAPPAICIVMLVFLPDSPVFLKKKKKDDKATAALQFYRGKDYDLTQDMKDIDDYIKGGEGSFKENMKKKANINGFIILLVLHVVQQLGGINAVMFYAGNIFSSGSFFGLKSNVCTCILGIVQVLGCGAAAMLVDRVGRRMLWLISLGIMSVSLVVCGVYFFIEKYQPDFAKKIEFILVIAICINVVGFCLGSGPLPWSMIGEMLSSGAKVASGPIITAINWILAYVVTVSYPYLNEGLGPGPVFFGYGVICILGFIFVLFVVIETKGKTLEEIQQALGATK